MFLKMILRNIRLKISLLTEWYRLRHRVKNWFLIYMIASSLLLAIVSKIRRRFMNTRDLSIKVTMSNGNTFQIPYDRFNELHEFLFLFENYLASYREYFPDDELGELKELHDLGGHIGLFGINAITAFPDTVVHIFEPNKDNCYLINKNISGNQKVICKSQNIKVHHAAVSNRDDILEFVIGRTSTTGSLNVSGFRQSENQTARQIDCVDYNRILSGIGELSFLKCDIEGSEYDVLFNLTSNNLRKIKRIIIEGHPTKYHKPTELISYLSENDFECHPKWHSNGCVDIYAKLNEN